MKAFLEELAENLIKRYGKDASSLTLVFPNRRAGLFFQKYLSNHISSPIWAPRIFSIEDFILKHSSLQVADKITLIFKLYETYVKHSPVSETFDRFYYWGDLLLNDFDEIDKYLIDAGLLFKDLLYQKELESTYDYLSTEQKEAIITFWSAFKSRLSRHQEDFLSTWKILYQVYQEFREALQNKGIGYGGMIYRMIAEEPQKYLSLGDNEKVIFVGLNALNKAEESIVKRIIQDGKGEIIWDTDSLYMDNPLHEAGVFLRRYRRDKIFSKTFPQKSPDTIVQNNERSVKITGVPSETGQVKHAAQLIGEISLQESWDPQRTAIILPDEKLLFPVLNSLPKQLKNINITMGYPLKDTPVFNYLESLIEIHHHVKNTNEGRSFYYKYLLPVVKHAYFHRFNPEKANQLIHLIENHNRISINEDEVGVSNNYPDIFKEVKEGAELIDLLLEVLIFMTTSDLSDIEKEYAFQLKKLLTRLQEIISTSQVTLNFKILLKLFRQTVQGARVPFSGEPLNGLQIMGALETRNLDFENVFILSFNEGSYPRTAHLHSFIPFNLRRGYGLPTFEQQDAIYSYNFYRLLQRAKNVYIFYNTNGNNGGGEMSRYLYQLIYGNQIQHHHVLAVSPINIVKQPLTEMAKSGFIMQKLNRYLDVSAAKALTPSAINIYLDCQMKFYFRYVVDLYEPNEVKEEVDPMVFGNLLHKTMETLYHDFEDVKMRKQVTPLELAVLKNKVSDAVKDAFQSEYGKKGAFDISGRNIIIAEIIQKMAVQVLDKDTLYAPFSILGLEGGAGGRPFNGFIEIKHQNSRHKVLIKGIVDRIDCKNDVVRIIDYKTGKDDKKIENIESLFDSDHPKRNKAAMQTILYSLIYLQNYGDKQLKITPGIFNIRELFSESFDHRLQLKQQNGEGYEYITDIRPYLPDFQFHLKNLLQEIFDASKSFTHTADERKCQYCPYVRICGR